MTKRTVKKTKSNDGFGGKTSTKLVKRRNGVEIYKQSSTKRSAYSSVTPETFSSVTKTKNGVSKVKRTATSPTLKGTKTTKEKFTSPAERYSYGKKKTTTTDGGKKSVSKTKYGRMAGVGTFEGRRGKKMVKEISRGK
jgi:hypothetical protein